MGILSKRVLGSVSGKIGDIQFRQRGDLNYIALNPDSFIPGTDEASVARRAKFGLAVRFSSAINSIDQVRTLWEPYTPPSATPFNQMLKLNYPYIDAGVIGDRAPFMPDWGFAVNTTSLDLTDAQLSVVLAALGSSTGIDEVEERDLYLAAVVHFSDPLLETDKPDEFISLLSVPQTIDLINPLTFSIPLDSVEGLIFHAYQTAKVFAALFTVDADDQPIRFSNSIIG